MAEAARRLNPPVGRIEPDPERNRTYAPLAETYDELLELNTPVFARMHQRAAVSRRPHE